MSEPYHTRCVNIAIAMQADNWPRKHSPLTWDDRYAQMWGAEFMARLLGEPGIPCPDMTGTAYEASWVGDGANDDSSEF